MIFLTGLSIIMIDQIVKAIITINIPYGAFIGKYIRITNIANTGMAYGIAQNSTILIIIGNIIAIGILLIFLLKNYKKIDNYIKIFLIMVISGGTSNLIDRIARGYVVDYINIKQILNYPIFNIADVSIVLGVILLIAYIVIKTIKKQENI